MIRPFASPLLVAALFAAAAHAQDGPFYEDFQGSELNPALRVLNPDRNRMALTEGEYLLLVVHPERKNVVEYAGTLPPDFAVTLRVSAPPSQYNQSIALSVGAAQSNINMAMYVSEYAGYPRTSFALGKTLEGERTPSIERPEDDFNAKPFYLRLEKRDVEYEGKYSGDGVTWTSLGTQVLITPSAPVSFSVVSWGSAPETPVKIDSFEIEPLN